LLAAASAAVQHVTEPVAGAVRSYDSDLVTRTLEGGPYWQGNRLLVEGETCSDGVAAQNPVDTYR
jgi:hypothetical protein